MITEDELQDNNQRGYQPIEKGYQPEDAPQNLIAPEEGTAETDPDKEEENN